MGRGFSDAGIYTAAHRLLPAGRGAGRLCQRIFSSAIAVILPLCIVSIVIYALHDSLPVSDALPYLIGGAAGGVLAGLLFRKMPARALHLILGGVILAGGIRLIVC